MVARNIALMSIHPDYVEKILAGEKRIELRRRRPGFKPGDLVLVYATSPVRQLAGAFAVERIVSMSVSAMWRKFRPVLGVCRDAYDAYFREREMAHGIAIHEAWSSPQMDLKELRRRFRGFVPPQSYMFWPERWSLPPTWRPERRAQILSSA